MIQFTFFPTSEFQDQFAKLNNEKLRLLGSILETLVFQAFYPHATYEIDINVHYIRIKVNGVAPFDKVEMDNYLQEIGSKLNTLKLRHLFHIKEIAYQSQRLDKLTAPSLIGKDNINESLRRVFDIEEKQIPSRFLCPITHVLMDTPVFLTSNPKVCYEKSALIKWISERQTDPLTRTPIGAVGIVDRSSLKEEISCFLEDCIKKGDITKYHQRTRDIGVGTSEHKESVPSNAPSSMLTQQTLFAPQKNATSENKNASAIEAVFEATKLKDEFQKLFGKALRKAAAVGDISSMNQLFISCSKDTILNQIDDNPKSKKTPLHYAIFYNQVEAAKLLIENGASINIPDVNNITAADLIKESSNEKIKSLIQVPASGMSQAYA